MMVISVVIYTIYNSLGFAIDFDNLSLRLVSYFFIFIFSNFSPYCAMSSHYFSGLAHLYLIFLFRHLTVTLLLTITLLFLLFFFPLFHTLSFQFLQSFLYLSVFLSYLTIILLPTLPLHLWFFLHIILHLMYDYSNHSSLFFTLLFPIYIFFLPINLTLLPLHISSIQIHLSFF